MKELAEKIRAGYPILAFKTLEEERLLVEIAASVGDRPLSVWTETAGLRGATNENCRGPGEFMERLNGIAGQVVVALDLAPYFSEPAARRLLKDFYRASAETGSILILVGSGDIHAEVKGIVAVVDYQKPDRATLAEAIDAFTATNGLVAVDGEKRERLLDAALGLDLSTAKNAFALAAIRNGGSIDVQTVMEEKVAAIASTGFLEYVKPGAGMDSIGGLESLKAWLSVRKVGFSPKARAAGLRAPKGILLVGPPGCGKSLSAKCCSVAWGGVPILRWDVASSFGSLVGQTEANFQEAIDTAEALGTCILWIDEIEKAFAGTGGSGNLDSGTTQRSFGKVLTWMSDKTSNVFVYATANNVGNLPPELIRKGRFDEIFAIDLPSDEERTEIFRIHLTARNAAATATPRNLTLFSGMSDGFSGAEIAEACESALFRAFTRSEDNPTMTTGDVMEEIANVNPLSKSRRADIERTREWANVYARPAGSTKKAPSMDGITGRKIFTGKKGE